VLLLPPLRGAKAVRPGSIFAGINVVADDLRTPGDRAVAAMVAADEPNGYGVRFMDYSDYSIEAAM